MWALCRRPMSRCQVSQMAVPAHLPSNYQLPLAAAHRRQGRQRSRKPWLSCTYGATLHAAPEVKNMQGVVIPRFPSLKVKG